ncbi:NADPH--cytochrome P450 reductase-like protein [Emericellopsis atlantica]|uniref:Bifunctional cytochrome P450/NADPH--P450 reductase n=1 Tax=Emericellopsis atlantica TaxID=2614577 RepID=A0A9P7ZQX9_9HYPO|nr:NADPH--cytochrome P450 reductase-like protein [Emericellopsis atlantica]KAG9256206.1 NADPH--cytochrome P450 reductase-like protein [Emericellopsis atlantica]
MSERIPGPKGLPLVGNLLDIQDEVPLHAIERISDIYGPLYTLNFPGGGQRYFCTGFELFNELCDETRFYKLAPKTLQDLGKSGSQGLFTSVSEHDIDWQVAHRILLPAFGPLAIESMFDGMYDIACQLTLKWARLGSEVVIGATSDFTRLTLDTIALCAMDYRFNSFYQEGLHPFVAAMTRVLRAGSEASQLTGILKSMMPSHAVALQKDRDIQKRIAMEIVQKRKDNPVDTKDLLNAMIYNKDPKTNQTMSDDLIAANMQTFLIAGHETTSGLLSFAFALLLKNPATLFKAQQEIDKVVGTSKITVKHLSQLPYITAVLRETLRLYPTAPAFNRGQRPENKAKEPIPTIGGGRFKVPEEGITCLMSKIHRDFTVWGADANDFNPDRMTDGKFEKLPRNAWMPFGTGSRSCIGRSFAWQEAMLVLIMILQNFDVRLKDPQYEIKVDQNLTIKPRDFEIRAALRAGLTASNLQNLQNRLYSNGPSNGDTSNDTHGSHQSDSNGKKGKPVQIMFGTTTGTTQHLATKLAATLSGHGWAPKVLDMDEAVKKINKDALQIFISSSYEGMPPDNANLFVSWLQSIEDSQLFDGVEYSVFGCGHSDWKHTFQRIPTIIDDAMAAAGARRVVDRGSSDAAKGDITGQFDDWADNQLLPAVVSSGPHSSASSGQQVPTVALTSAVAMELKEQGRAAHLQQKVDWAVIKAAGCLTPPGEPEKRHLEIKLPEGVSYSVGDYLMVLPRNSESQIRRVIRRFSVPSDSVITISDGGSTTLPVNVPLPVSELLMGYVELTQPATKKDIATLSSHTKPGQQKEYLQSLTATEDTYTSEVSDKRISSLDLLERCNDIEIPFAGFLALLPPLKTRLYSISSSPLASPNTCSMTYTVINAPHLSSRASDSQSIEDRELFHGVTGTYLRDLKAGDQIQVAIRSSNKYFRPPVDMTAVPMVMICAGTGLAPFRGFVEERAVMIKDGHRDLAPAILFVGCRAPSNDQLYKDEFDEWERIGAVKDRVWHNREEVSEAWQSGAKFYVCGSKEMAKSLGEVAQMIVAERQAGQHDLHL